ncbi:MAG: 50S ribosomal protein L25 [Desulfobacteraceae bacterium]|nr:50S ribosomal protein L25 [Desulfobacteraceae bacterium]
MNTIELKAKTRTTKGNGPARRLRREGHLPAVLYGPKTEPNLLSISIRDLEMLIKNGNLGRCILNLDIDDGKRVTYAMVKELQTHPLTRSFIHIDLYEIDMKRKIRVNIPVTTVGKSAGVEMGGMLEIIRRELEVLCLPSSIPNDIVIDITDIGIGGSVHVEDIQLEGDVEIFHDVNFTVVAVTSAKKEKEEEEEEVEAAEEDEAAEEGKEEEV